MNTVEKKVEDILNDKILKSHSVAGGCIAQSSLIETIKGHQYFLKQGLNNGMFICEAHGLKELQKANTLKTPKVIHYDEDFLLLEAIKSGIKSRNTFIKFGKQFAKLHQFTNHNFGFYEDNYIGLTPQINSTNELTAVSWSEFYFNNRLLHQFKLAEKNGYTDEKLTKAFRIIEQKVDIILKGSEEAPSLLHGDLWGGNYMVDSNGEIVIIDPAVYYGHREADLAMTKLFGGFSPDFYKAYNETFPLKDGSEYRENLYLLYHVLNHLNLFGYSYYNQCLQLMQSYQ